MDGNIKAMQLGHSPRYETFFQKKKKKNEAYKMDYFLIVLLQVKSNVSKTTLFIQNFPP